MLCILAEICLERAQINVSKLGILRYMLKQLKSIVRKIVRPALHKADVHVSYKVLGSEYGGWPLIRDLTPRSPLIYSFGIGEDISFDLAAIAGYDAFVHAFDPTPRCLKWIERQDLPARFQFHALGISSLDGEVEFFAPEEAEHVSFSAQPAKHSDRMLAVKAPVRRLQTIMDSLGTQVPDVLKMDIEGFEYEVLEDLLSSPVRPTQLLIEFHHYMYGISTKRTQSAVHDLQRAGYEIFYVSASGHEYGFVNRRELGR
jgi:FkbM family methyltransferase